MTGDAEATADGSLSTERRALFTGPELPWVHVRRQLVVEGRPRARQEWVFGPAPGDCLRIANAFLPYRSGFCVTGTWLHLEGSERFREAVDRVLRDRLPCRLSPEEPSSSDALPPQPEIPEDGAAFLGALLARLGFAPGAFEALRGAKPAPPFRPEGASHAARARARAKTKAREASQSFHRGRPWRHDAESALRSLAASEALVEVIDWG